MRRFNWTLSIVPNGDDQNIYLVVDDFGRNRAWREEDVEATDLQPVIEIEYCAKSIERQLRHSVFQGLARSN